MRITTRAAAAAALSIAFLVPATAASAQYTGGGGAEVEPDDGDVLPADEELNGAEAGPAAVETAPTGSLPITGGDVVGLTVAGGGAIAIGALMVRRSRRPVPA